MASEIETNMVGVERIKEYQEIKEEAPLEMPGQDPDADWPKYGVVKFDNYQTRYREGLDLVLKGIDCHIRSGEKVGIVGRTGAGELETLPWMTITDQCVAHWKLFHEPDLSIY